MVNQQQHTVYQIRLMGHLGGEWVGWFDGLAVTLEDSGETLLTGAVPDQAALHGLLKKVRDLGLPLVSVNQINLGVNKCKQLSARNTVRQKFCISKMWKNPAQKTMKCW